MSWLILVASGALEAVWAVALDKSQGFTRAGPTLLFVAALALSMGGLALALRELPLGTGYAAWVGIGAILTVAYGMATGAEPVSALRLVFLAAIIAGVVGLKLVR